MFSDNGQRSNERVSKQKLVGRKQVRRDQKRAYRANKQLQTEVKQLQRKVWTLIKAHQRKRKELDRTPNLTPKKKMAKLTEGKFVSPEVKQALFKGLVLEEECKAAKEKCESSQKVKKVFHRLLNGNIVKRYKLLKDCRNL